MAHVPESTGIYGSLLLGIQATLMNMIGMVYVPLVMMSYLCLLPDDSMRTGIIASVFFISALATALQDSLGFNVALLIIPSLSFIRNSASLLNIEGKECPGPVDPDDDLSTAKLARNHEFNLRSAELQTAVLISSILYASLVLSGLLMYIYRKISPGCVSSILIAHSLNSLSDCFNTIEISTPIIIVLSVGTMCYMLRNVQITFPLIWPDGNCDLTTIKLFKTLPMLMTLPIICLYFYLVPSDEANIEGGGNANGQLQRAVSAHPGIFTFPLFGIAWPLFSIDMIFVAISSLFVQIAMTLSCFYAFNCLSGMEVPNDRVKNGFLVEAATSAFSSLFKFPMIVGVNPISIGLMSFTNVSNSWVSKSTSIIILYLSFFAKTSLVITYIPFLFFFGWNLILIACSLASGIFLGNFRSKHSALRVAISVLFAMVLSKVRVDFGADDGAKVVMESVMSGSGLIAGLVCWTLELFTPKKFQPDFKLPPFHI